MKNKKPEKNGQSTLLKITYVLGAVVVFLAVANVMVALFKRDMKNLGSRPANEVTSRREDKPSPEQVPAENPKSETVANRYINHEYEFSFRLEDGERVIECPNKNQYSNEVAVVPTTKPRPQTLTPQDECAHEGSGGEFFAGKVRSDITPADQVRQLKENGYVLKETQITLSDLPAVRVTGKRDESSPAPLPVNIDEVILKNNDFLYIIPAQYLSREVKIGEANQVSAAELQRGVTLRIEDPHAGDFRNYKVKMSIPRDSKAFLVNYNAAPAVKIDNQHSSVIVNLTFEGFNVPFEKVPEHTAVPLPFLTGKPVTRVLTDTKEEGTLQYFYGLDYAEGRKNCDQWQPESIIACVNDYFVVNKKLAKLSCTVQKAEDARECDNVLKTLQIEVR